MSKQAKTDLPLDAQWTLDHLQYDIDLSTCTKLREAIMLVTMGGVRGRQEIVRYLVARRDEAPCLRSGDIVYRINRACDLLGFK